MTPPDPHPDRGRSEADADPAPSGLEQTLDAPTAAHHPGSPLTDTRVGPYRLLERLGEGGFGLVYLAEQRTPVRRRVALKLIKPGMDTREVVARFEAERQALALLDHPGIARIHDAGTTEAGRPYFVMEYIAGDPITEYAARAKLTLPQRLRLVIQVCEAVQHAHQKGILHRDLKPSNVLVADDEGKPRPVIIDFGIAKALGEPLTDKTMHTQLGQLIGTPAYMSPEQTGGRRADVDTRTDIYSIGVILYELLTGALPFDPTTAAGDWATLQRTIRELDPPKPSTRVRKHGGGARSSKPSTTLARALEGDLDWITMKALEKQRERRYRSASELAADLERHRHDEPVLAGPPSRTYRFKKFVRRNRTLVALAGGVTSALVLGMAGTGYGLVQAQAAQRRSEAEAARAQAVNLFLNDMLSSVEPDRGLGHDVTVAEVLDDAGRRVDGAFEDQPDVEAALRVTLGSSNRTLGRYPEAETHLRRAVELRRARGLPEPRAEAELQLGLLLVETGRLPEARTLIDSAVATMREAAGPRSAAYASALDDRGVLLATAGEHAEAERCYREALSIEHEVPPAERTLLPTLLTNLGMLLEETGRYDDAEKVLREAEGLRLAAGRAGLAGLIDVRDQLALLKVRRADPQGAEALFRQCLATAIEVYGEGHPDVARQQCQLAEVLQEQGRLDEAESLFRAAVATFRRVTPGGTPALATALTNLAWVRLRQGHADDAETLQREALAMKRKLLPEDHPQIGNSLNDLAAVLRERGRYTEAEALNVEALRLFRQAFGDEHLHTAIGLHSLGVTILESKDYARALPWLEQAVTTIEKVLPPSHWQVAEFRKRYAEALAFNGRFQDALAQLEKAYAAMHDAYGPEHPRTVGLAKRIIDVARGMDRTDLVEQWRAKLPAGQRDY